VISTPYAYAPDLLAGGRAFSPCYYDRVARFLGEATSS
jgi:hypothetical protein